MVLGRTLAQITRHSLVAVVLALLIGIAAQAQGPTVRVLAVTHVQAVLEITAPDSGYCTVEVSEDASYTPLVHDVDTTIAWDSDANPDRDTSRDTTVCDDGTCGDDAETRTVVIGRYGMDVPAGGTNWWKAGSIYYSRALAAETTHYYRVRCTNGTGTATTGSFTTQVMPLGMTRSGIQVPNRSPGVANFPTVPSDRESGVIDPLTGTKWWRVDLAAEMDGDELPGWMSGGMHQNCQKPLYSGGHLCWFQVLSNNQGGNSLYWIDDTGAPPTIYLQGNFSIGIKDQVDDNDERDATGVNRIFPSNGETDIWDETTGGVFYSTGATNYVDGGGVRHWSLYKYTYSNPPATGGTRTQFQLPGVTEENLTKPSESRSLTTLLSNFSANYDPEKYVGATVATVTGNYVLLYARRYGQDSYGWIGVYDLSTDDIIAFHRFGEDDSSRWCGIHTFLPSNGGFPYADIAPQYLRGGVSTGPWATKLDAAMEASPSDEDGGLAGIQDTITVEGEPVCTNGDPNVCYGESAANDTTFLDAAPGDLLFVGSEKLTLVSKTTAVDWVVTRGARGSTKAAHSIDDYVYEHCSQVESNGEHFRELFWDFVNDPTGSGAGMYWDDVLFNGHFQSSYSAFRGTVQTQSQVMRVGTAPGIFGDAYTYAVETMPTFAGVAAHCAGNNCQKHVSLMHLDSPTAADHEWVLDAWPFIGTAATLSPAYGLDGPIDSSTYIYQYTPSQTLNQKALEVFGIKKNIPLQNVSHPTTDLTDTAGDNFKFCVAAKAGECWTGSVAGEVYINLDAAPDYMQCGAGAEGPPTGALTDVCIGLVPSTQNTLVQFELGTAERSRPLLSYMYQYRNGDQASSARGMPDGSGLLGYLDFSTNRTDPHVVWMKKQSWVLPTVDYSTFVPVTLTIPAGQVPATTTNIIVNWGYAEYGTPGNFRCLPRQEACIIGATATTANYTTYYWPSETAWNNTGLSCAAGCSPVLPIAPGKVAYAQVTFRDSGNSTTGTSQVYVLPGLSQITRVQ